MIRLTTSLTGVAIVAAGLLHAQTESVLPNQQNSSPLNAQVAPVPTFSDPVVPEVVPAQPGISGATPVSPPVASVGQGWAQAGAPHTNFGSNPEASFEAARCRLEWGLTLIQLPDYLRNEQLGLLPDQGMLVTGVDPYSTAANAGILPGNLILDVDGQPAIAGQPLPRLEGPRKLLVMTNNGTFEITVEPSQDALLGNQLGWESGLQDRLLDDLGREWSADELGLPGSPIRDRALNLIQRMRQIAPVSPISPLGTGGFGLSSRAGIDLTAASNVHSFAMNEVNGDICVRAIVDCATGPERVELRGSQAQIEAQLRALSPELRSSLAPHLGL